MITAIWILAIITSFILGLWLGWKFAMKATNIFPAWGQNRK